MTVNDFWVLSPEIAMALLALSVITADLITRNVVKVLFIACVGLTVPLFFALNLWYGWFGDPVTGSALF
jgi:hypothetical protein